MGARSKQTLQKTIRHIFELGIVTACALSLLFFAIGDIVVTILTNVPAIISTSEEYLVWVYIAPVAAVWCYILDGIFIGATRTNEMRNAMLFSLLVYLLSFFTLDPLLGNHGLWLSLMIYFLARGVSLAWYLPRISAT